MCFGIAYCQSNMQGDLTPQDLQAWDQLWQRLFDIKYQAYFEEMCIERSLTWWKRVDIGAKILHGATTSGSAVAGWSLWNDPEYKTVWAIVAGGTALLSLTNIAVNVSEKLKEDTVTYTEFRSIRIHCDRLQHYMQIGAYERLSDYLRDFVDIWKEFEASNTRKKPDFFLTEKAKITIQTRLNRSLGYE